MKIAEVKAFPLEIPTKQKYNMAGGTHAKLSTLVVKMTLEDGTSGFGDAHVGVANYSYESLESMYQFVTYAIAPTLIGESIDEYERLYRKMDAVRTGHNFAKSAVEIALFDALGKYTDTSVATILGGALRQEVEVIGGMGIQEIEAMVDKAHQLVDEGYKTLKIKVGTAKIFEDIERIRAVSEAVGNDIKLRVDANAGYHLPDALTVLKKIKDLDNIEHLEQPVPGWDLEGMKRLRKASCIPLAADESVHTPQDAFRVIASGAVDKIKIKISKAGGFLNARKIINVAESAGIPIVIGQGICTTIESLAELHVAVSCSNVIPMTEIIGPTKIKSDIVEETLPIKNGYVQLPSKPGLGMDVNEDFVTKYVKKDLIKA